MRRWIAIPLLALMLANQPGQAANTQTPLPEAKERDGLVRDLVVTHCEIRAFMPLNTCIKGLNWAVQLELDRRYGPDWAEKDFHHARLYADFRFATCANYQTFRLFHKEFGGTTTVLNAWVSYLIDCFVEFHP
ncbi:MAG: hypothetical protein AAF557_10180 [Pseudomonadota bacterium]